MAKSANFGGNGLRVYQDINAWEDMRIVPGAFQFPGVADPTLSTWQIGGAGTTFRIYEFNSNDEVSCSIQIPHAWKVGGIIKPHIHWTPRDRGTAESGNSVAWKIDYTVGDVSGAMAASATVDLTDTCTGTNDLHEITPSGSIDLASYDISAMLFIRLYRDAGDTWNTNSAGNRPALMELDFHYQIDTPGSDAETSKDS